MKTIRLDASQPGAIERAAALLRGGHLVLFPTDTLYGLGANVFDQAAVAGLYRVKERPLSKGIPVLLGDPVDVEKVARALPQQALALVERFWPGPLTLVVPRRQNLPSNLSPDENVAVRLPDDEVARALIRAAGGAVATTSANRSGQPPARDAGEALAALGGLVAAVLDSGPAPHGIPSTVVDCTVTPFRVLRAGPLSPDALRDALAAGA